MEQSRFDVNRWQAARPQWHYSPVMWFYWRMVKAALLDVRCDAVGRPTDEALLVRDWVARSEADPRIPVGNGRRFVSFPECCEQLGLNAENERLALLALIDNHCEFDTDEAWERLEALSAAQPSDDEEPLFEGLRIVPALDQMTLFQVMGE